MDGDDNWVLDIANCVAVDVLVTLLKDALPVAALVLSVLPFLAYTA